MTCERMHDAISAIADGEDPGMDLRLVDAHLRTCPSCRAFRAVAAGTGRSAMIEEAPPMPDLSRRVVKVTSMMDRASTWSAVRAALAVVAVEIVVTAIPSLTASSETGVVAHDSRHLGAFAIAYAVALFAVVVRPARSRTVLPVTGVLAGMLLITAVIDLINGNVPLLGEAGHLPELISVGLVWAMAVPGRRRPTPGRTAAPDATSLRLVEDDATREAG